MFDKDDQEISQIIETGLEAIVSGKATLEEIVAQHPEHAKALRAELEVALWLVSSKEQVSPRPGFVAASRKRVVSRIKEEARNSGSKRSIFGFIWPQKVAYQWVAALLALVILFSGTGGVVTISQSALPGDSLYSVKQASESIAMAVTINEVRKVELSASFVERRVEEAELLIGQGKFEQAEKVLQVIEEQVSQTVSLLQNIENTSAHDHKVLAVVVHNQLTEQAERLEQLQNDAPPAIKAELEDTETLTLAGAMLAGDEAENIVDPTTTPVPTLAPSETPLPSASPLPQLTDTPVVAETPEPRATETVGGDDVLDPSLVPDPADPTRLVTKTPRPTNENRPTPKPANENKPTKEPNNPGDDGGGGSNGGGNNGGGGGGDPGGGDPGGGSGQPDKPDKPDKNKDK